MHFTGQNQQQRDSHSLLNKTRPNGGNTNFLNGGTTQR
ncbi:hypothetical protein T4D_6801 [Trichinella pseudospiralis]|uniref:Uncharacterized protein n=1 Tax=Trichinella pseudospiralis TaxID=6337 RepID=A0A0V1DMR0_TRIPS|nr:hypothetical protein T4D_6801 [Trichinella pseudospiralis]